MIDFLGHCGYILLIVGSIYVGRQQAAGWALRFLGSATWTVLGIELGLTSVWLWSGAFAIVDLRNWRKWNATLPEPENDQARRG